MDVKKIKYNHELFKNQVKLERQLVMVEEELDKAKKNCYHIVAITGEKEEFNYRQCLLCGSKSFRNNDYLINAVSYKKDLYGHGENMESRQDRYLDLQNLTVRVIEENPDLDEYNLYVKLKEEIEGTNKQKQKIK